jgi:hypothetical protein
MKNSFYFVFGFMIAALLMLPYLSNGSEKKASSSGSSKVAVSGSRSAKLTLKADSLKRTLKPSVTGSKGQITLTPPVVKDRMSEIRGKSSVAPSSSTSIK